MVNPLTKLNYDIIWEIYTNDIPIEDQLYSFTTMVRGREIYFSRDAINTYIGDPLTLEECELDDYEK